MMSILIPFEVHLTVEPIAVEQQSEFLSVCNALDGAKPLFIELGRGSQREQPMCSFNWSCETLDAVLTIALEKIRDIELAGFPVKRLKIEVPLAFADRAGVSQPSPGTKNSGAASLQAYYEWHCRIELSKPDELLSLCLAHGAHLSRNALNSTPQQRFITMREYKNADVFQQRTQNLAATLLAGGWTIHGQECEYCVYDSCVALDVGWLQE